MKCFLAIDGGTTNTRVCLVKDGTVADTVKLPIGARASMDGNEPLKIAVRDAIASLLARNSLAESDITRILASGMITSEYGLCPLPHLTAPAGLEELHAAMHETRLPEISQIPFVFLRGVKTAGDTLECADMMRGEETELMGILRSGSCVYVLPGSHSKVVYTDENGRITSFTTLLTGEMIAALSEGTILRDAVDLSVSTVDEAYLKKGYDFCHKTSLNEAIFKTRVLKNRFGCTKEETYSFFLGAILYGDIVSILRADAETVVIGGREQIKNAIAILLGYVSDKKIVTLSKEEVDTSVARGMLRVYAGKSFTGG